MVAEGRVALRRGALDDAIAVLQAALDMSERTDSKEYELEINDLLATAFKRSGGSRRRSSAARPTTTSTGRCSRTPPIYGSAPCRSRTRPRPPVSRPRSSDSAATTSKSWAATDGAPIESPSSATTQHLEAFEQLAILTEFRDAETGEHTDRVGDMSAEIAHAFGKSPEWCEQLRLAARLHDIGKVAVPDSVLRKTGPLTVEEYEMMKSHTSMGHRILAGNSAPMFQMAAEIAQSHHEWWDGSGYPLGISHTSIALTGRIVGLADVYDALCSKRPYKRAWAEEEAARFVVSGRGAQFDPDVVDAFVAVLRARRPRARRDTGLTGPVVSRGRERPTRRRTRRARRPTSRCGRCATRC